MIGDPRVWNALYTNGDKGWRMEDGDWRSRERGSNMEQQQWNHAIKLKPGSKLFASKIYFPNPDEQNSLMSF